MIDSAILMKSKLILQENGEYNQQQWHPSRHGLSSFAGSGKKLLMSAACFSFTFFLVVDGG